MSKTAKKIFTLLAIAAVFILINCTSAFTPIGRIAADCFVLAFITYAMYRGFSRRKRRKVYRDLSIWLVPLFFFGAFIVGMAFGRPLVNSISWMVGFLFSALLFHVIDRR
jgi:NhaP-type Na+/H+ or K+/H+ antiporter